jgi:tetratricopeptide (TPR) repeat protein
MDGRTSVVVALGLLWAVSGCTTSHVTKAVSLRGVDEPPPPGSVAATNTDAPKKPVPSHVLYAYAQMKEKDADAAKQDPERQAKLRDQARQVYQDLVKMEPKNLDAERGLARVYTRMGDYQRATETYQKAVAQHPKNPELWHDYAMMFNRQRQWDEAIKCLSKGLEADPENQRCLKTLGFTLARAGRVDESVPYLTRATGSKANAHYHVAQMLLHLSDLEPAPRAAAVRDQARAHLRMALHENPAFAQAADLMTHIDQPTSPIRQAATLQFAGH